MQFLRKQNMFFFFFVWRTNFEFIARQQFRMWGDELDQISINLGRRLFSLQFGKKKIADVNVLAPSPSFFSLPYFEMNVATLSPLTLAYLKSTQIQTYFLRPHSSTSCFKVSATIFHGHHSIIAWAFVFFLFFFYLFDPNFTRNTMAYRHQEKIFDRPYIYAQLCEGSRRIEIGHDNQMTWRIRISLEGKF